MIDNNLKHAIKLFNLWKIKKQEQSLRGTNDFNIFTTLLNMDDEVRLHSRFIHSLLDPKSDHGQGSFFLDLFLQQCGLSGEGINTSRCEVKKEHHNFDLFISDGNTHIIIENKVHAGDQDKQIERYIKRVKDEFSPRNKGSVKIIVIYLTLDGRNPSTSSLGEYKLSEVTDNLSNGESEYPFKAISYENEISKWLKKSENEISNITNLSVIIKQYQEVVMALYNRNTEKLMTLYKFVQSRPGSEGLHDAKNIIGIQDSPPLRDSLFNEFLKTTSKELGSGLPHGWRLADLDEVDASKLHQTFIKVIQTSGNAKIYFAAQFNEDQHEDLFFGVAGNPPNPEVLRKNHEIKSILNAIDGALTPVCDHWVQWDYYFKGDLLNHYLESGSVEKAALKFSKKFLKLIYTYQKAVEKMNIVCEEMIILDANRSSEHENEENTEIASAA